MVKLSLISSFFFKLLETNFVFDFKENIQKEIETSGFISRITESYAHIIELLYRLWLTNNEFDLEQPITRCHVASNYNKFI